MLIVTDTSHPLEITKHFLHYHNNFVRKVSLLHLFYRCDLSKVIQVVVLVQGPEAKPPGLRIVFKLRDHCWAGEHSARALAHQILPPGRVTDTAKPHSRRISLNTREGLKREEP